MIEIKHMTQQKTLFSGIQPSGRLSIANYIGAISQWVTLQNKYQCIFSVVDYHSITIKQDPNELRQCILEIVKIYLAAGIDPSKNIIFQQSSISAHTELAWILNCYAARISDLSKMTQFKDKSGKNQESVSVGLYDYPVLMAADILLYDTDFVPVGEDQRQHVELTRDLARRFNNEFGLVFKIPELIIKKEGARIMSLQDPNKKMSKSDANQNSWISLLEEQEEARKKIMKAVTDSSDEIDYDAVNKPGISNLLTIYAQLGNREIPRLVKDYKGKGYGEFKKDLAEVVVKFLENFQNNYKTISDDKAKLILEEGKLKAARIAQAKLDNIKQLIGVQ